MTEKWTAEAANRWWDEQKWPVGPNYVTSDAVNDVQMWMDATFNPELIRRELSWAADIGLNSLRVFLSYTVWENEREIFERNFETFLTLSEEAGMSVMPVLFDDCAFDGGADPVYGPQPDPIPGVHNSRWVPSPGFTVQDDPARLEACRAYVEAIIGAHRSDPRIIVWDLYNEPGNTKRTDKSLPLLRRAFQWAREAAPLQPLTVGPWHFGPEYAEVNRICFEESDVISIHAYTPMEATLRRLERARQYGRPILITEWMHRPNGNFIEDHLPLFCREKIGAWHWGLVRNRTQTHLWANHTDEERASSPWQHDLLHPDGSPYIPGELALFRSLSPR